ncbi:hypothetical protein PUNSTDRAFT_83821 [Punctularia strigosozonata HHB-11173 SS5]|uniref:uncharacterized protein n=1 Tax=Punctularia strigosozonata (strain HHB-11173) TaxID=741275 RepID=UPI00044162AD|nr:uncharacterized protein PUNSTDRAFT_83821 [Punctularia strigosozonata HHB-11173 SS5]EIN11951.1 hypothetical protein PUNSTDRAFT_83821 [Punctularia strigosozonata HHB-11173 SS5]
MAANSKAPLPITDTLRDLAVLRASDIDLSSLLPPRPESNGTAVDKSVLESYQFVKEARAALRILNRGDVEAQGAKVEDLRGKLEDILNGLSST